MSTGVYDLENLAQELAESYGTSLEMLTVSERIPDHIRQAVSVEDGAMLCDYVYQRAQEIARGE